MGAHIQIPEREINYRANILFTDVPTEIVESLTEIWTRPSYSASPPSSPFVNGTGNISQRCG